MHTNVTASVAIHINTNKHVCTGMRTPDPTHIAQSRRPTVRNTILSTCLCSTMCTAKPLA